MADFIRCVVFWVLFYHGIVDFIFELSIDHLCHVIKYLINFFVHFCAYFMVPDAVTCCQVPALLFRYDSIIFCSTNWWGNPFRTLGYDISSNLGIIDLILFRVIVILRLIRQVDLIRYQHYFNTFVNSIIDLLHPFF